MLQQRPREAEIALTDQENGIFRREWYGRLQVTCVSPPRLFVRLRLSRLRIWLWTRPFGFGAVRAEFRLLFLLLLLLDLAPFGHLDAPWDVGTGRRAGKCALNPIAIKKKIWGAGRAAGTSDLR